MRRAEPGSASSTDIIEYMNHFTRERIDHDIAEVLFVDAEDLTPQTNLLDLGLESIRLQMLVDRWRAAGMSVDFDNLGRDLTLEHWYSVLCTERDIAQT